MSAPLRAEFLPLTGVLSDTRERSIDPHRHERRAPKVIAPFLLLVLAVALWTLVWQLGKLALLLWYWAEPAAEYVGGLVGAAVIGMFLIGLGLFG